MNDKIMKLRDRLSEKLSHFQSRSKRDRIVFLCAVLGIIVVSAVSVFVVRALLTDFTMLRENVFASMTYTNIDIVEPNGKTYNVTITYNGQPSSSKDGTVSNKQAVIRNLPGSDKKPVYLRSKIIMTITDKNGIDITAQYSHGDNKVELDPNCLYYLHDAGNQNPNRGSEWTLRSDGYYYYNRILLPGETTLPLFRQKTNGSYGSTSWNKVNIKNAAYLPDEAVVHVDILADTVQAVSTDTVKWTVKDYYKDEARTEAIDEVSTAWGFKPRLPAMDPANAESLYGVLYNPDYTAAYDMWYPLNPEYFNVFLNAQQTLPLNWTES